MERLLLPVLALFWGLNWPAVKTALSAFEPFMLRTIGPLSAGLLLFAAALAMRRSFAVPGRAVLPLIVSGLFTVAGFNLFVVFAQLATTTSRAAILTYTMPLWAALFARLLLGEKLDRRAGLALALGAAGLAVLALPLLQGGYRPVSLLFPIGAAISWALGIVWQKKVPIPVDRLVSTGWQLMVGAAVAAIGMVAVGESLPAFPLPVAVTVALVFHIVCATAIAYVMWFSLVDRLTASASAIASLAVPVVGVLGAMALVGDRPTLADWIGFTGISSAAALILTRPRPIARPPE